MNDEEFDFGFSSVSNEDLTKSIVDYKAKMDRLYEAILPLLSNLAKGSEDDHIYWPNRKQKIEEFKQKLEAIIKD